MNHFRFLVAGVYLFGFSLAWGYPQPQGRVNDFAGLLAPATVKSLAAEITAFEAQTQHQFAVVTVTSLEGNTVEAYTLGLARTWGVGRKDSNDGVVLLVAPHERKMRIEVGRGLEGVLPNGACDRIIQDIIVPAFRRGDMEAGTVAGARAIMQTLFTPATPPAAAAPSTPALPSGTDHRLFDQTMMGIGQCLLVLIPGALLWYYAQNGRARRREFQARSDECSGISEAFQKEAKEAKPLLEALPLYYPPDRVAAMTKDFQKALAVVLACSGRLGRLVANYNPWQLGSGKDYDTLVALEYEMREARPAVQEVTQAEKRGRDAKEWMDAKRAPIVALIQLAQPLLVDERVGARTKEVLRQEIRQIEAFQAVTQVTDWVKTAESWAECSNALSKAIARAEGEIKTFDQAPAEAARLLKELPAVLAKWEKSSARSSSARAQLAEARRSLAQATSQCQSGGGGLGPMDWYLIYLLLSNTSTAASQSEATVQREARQAQEEQDRADRARRDERSSSSDSGSSSFGGGDFGGGGGSGSW